MMRTQTTPDLSKLSDEELFRIAGIKPDSSQYPQSNNATPDLSKLPDEELFRIAGIEPIKPSMLKYGVKKGLASIAETGANIFGGLEKFEKSIMGRETLLSNLFGKIRKASEEGKEYWEPLPKEKPTTTAGRIGAGAVSMATQLPMYAIGGAVTAPLKVLTKQAIAKLGTGALTRLADKLLPSMVHSGATFAVATGDISQVPAGAAFGGATAPFKSAIGRMIAGAGTGGALTYVETKDINQALETVGAFGLLGAFSKVIDKTVDKLSPKLKNAYLQKTDKYIKEGMTEDEARAAAFNEITDTAEGKKELKKINNGLLNSVKETQTEQPTLTTLTTTEPEITQPTKPGFLQTAEDKIMAQKIVKETAQLGVEETKAGITQEPQGQAMKSGKPEISTLEPPVKLYAGIPLEDMRDYLVKRFPNLEQFLGTPSEINEIVEKPDKMKLTEKIFGFPETLGKKHHLIKDFVEINENREEEAARGEYRVKNLTKWLNKYTDEDVMKALTVRIKSSGTGDLDPSYYNLTKEQKAIFDHLDREVRHIWSDHIKSQQDKIIEFVNATKSINPENKQAMINAIKSINPKAPVLNEHKTVKRWVQMLSELSGKIMYYVPQSRIGKAMVYIKDDAGITHYAQAFDTKTEAVDFHRKLQDSLSKGDLSVLMEWYKKAGRPIDEGFLNKIKEGKITIGSVELTKLPYEAVEGFNMQRTYDIIKTMAEEKVADEKVLQALIDDIFEWNLQKGWSKHLIHRENIPGYELDPKKVKDNLEGYMRGYWASKAKGKAIQEVNKKWSELVTQRPIPEDIITYLKDYIDYTFGSGESKASREITHTVSSLALYADILSAITNATQNFTTGMAAYIHYGIKPTRLFGAWNDLATKNLSHTDKRALVELLKRGKSDSLIFEEMVGEGTKDIRTIGLIPFKMVETYVNRIPHYLGAFRDIYAKTKDFDYAVKEAIEVLKEGHFWASRYNRPKFMRGDVGRMMTTLATFTAHYFKQLNRYYNEREIGALAYLVGSGLVLGGAAAIPGGELTMTVAKKLYSLATGGKNLSADIKSLPSKTREFIEHGIFGLIGVPSMSQRIGVGFSENPMRNFAVVSFGKNLADAYKLANQHQYELAIDKLLFGGFKDIANAYWAHRHGLTTSTGTPILDEKGKPIKLTGSEIAQLSIGLLSSRLTQLREASEIVRETREEKSANLTKFRNDYLLADQAGKRQVLKQIMEYNREIRKKMKETDNMIEKKRLSMLLINRQDLKASIRGKLRGSITSLGGKKGFSLYRDLVNEHLNKSIEGGQND